jgi:hypothetical protein
MACSMQCVVAVVALTEHLLYERDVDRVGRPQGRPEANWEPVGLCCGDGVRSALRKLLEEQKATTVQLCGCRDSLSPWFSGALRPRAPSGCDHFTVH